MGRIQKALERAKLERQTVHTRVSLSDTAIRRKLEVTPDIRAGDGKRLADMKLHSMRPSIDTLHHNRVVSSLFDSQANAIDAYRMLRTKTLRRLVSNQWRFLAVTSPTRGEGKTLTSLNLALSISQDPNFDVILVDADLRSPSVHTQLGIKPDVGLFEYLEGNADLNDVLLSPSVKGLGIIPNMHAIENSSEALTSSRMQELMTSLRTLSSAVIVIVDMPPLVVDDVLAFAPMVDSLMLVFRAGVTSRADAAAAREMTTDLNVIGCVMNGIQGGTTGTYY